MLLTLAVPGTAAAQQVCAAASGVQEGWAAYRSLDDETARDRFAEVVDACPETWDAHLGLGLALSRLGRYDAAEQHLLAVRTVRPGDMEAVKALARLAGWRGRTEQSRALWMEVLSEHPDDLEARLGVARVLRWAGRSAEAESQLRQARAQAPDDEAVAQEWLQLRTQRGPVLGTGLTWESDSDANRVITSQVRATLSLGSGPALRWRTVFRDTKLDGARHRQALEHFVETDWTLPSGHRVSGGLGLSETSILDNPVSADGRIRVSSPAGPAMGWAVDYAQHAVPYTSQMVERGVRTQALGVQMSHAPGSRWRLLARAEAGRYEGHMRNGRWGAQAAVSRAVTRLGRLGVTLRGFGYESDVNDGYYDPKAFGQVEMPWSGAWKRGAVSVNSEVAPGLQGVDGEAGMRGSLRVSSLLRWQFARSGSLDMGGAWAHAGAQRLGDGAGSYRYRSVSVAGTWVF